jgi:hypothetical protein
VLQLLCALAGAAAEHIVIAVIAGRTAKSAPVELRLRIHRPPDRYGETKHRPFHIAQESISVTRFERAEIGA